MRNFSDEDFDEKLKDMMDTMAGVNFLMETFIRLYQVDKHDELQLDIMKRIKVEVDQLVHKLNGL